MDRNDVFAVLDQPISQELLGSSIPARLAYTGLDGNPRVVPLAFWWDRPHVVMATAPTSAKVRALQQNPRIAITIDTQDEWPPRALFLRGCARLAEVDGVPDEYIEGARKLAPTDLPEGWDAVVRSLYDSMTRIVIEPDWAKLLDFETTMPRAVGPTARRYHLGLLRGRPGC